jgi:hypothetical protein
MSPGQPVLPGATVPLRSTPAYARRQALRGRGWGDECSEAA